MPWLLPPRIEHDDVRTLTNWIGALAERLDDPSQDRNLLVRDVLAELVYGTSFDELSERAPMAAFALDPRRVTFEAEQYIVTDQNRFASVKPLLWAWTQVDGTPFGRSMATGIPFRRMLAKRVFARAGRGLKIFPGVELSLGYNIEAGDGVVLHRNVYLDDIGGIELHDGASLADEVHVYSHTHDVRESDDVILKRTVIGRGVRVAYHATVLAGTVLSDDVMLGAMAVATRSVDPHVVALGVPARPHLRKDRNGDARFRELVVDARMRAPTPEIRANPDFATRVASHPVPSSIDERLAPSETSPSESSPRESTAGEPSPRKS